jgi:hypothetical protein
MSVAQFVEKALVALLLSADISRAPVANAFWTRPAIGLKAKGK